VRLVRKERGREINEQRRLIVTEMGAYNGNQTNGIFFRGIKGKLPIYMAKYGRRSYFFSG
jgi:hypothetical protein